MSNASAWKVEVEAPAEWFFLSGDLASDMKEIPGLVDARVRGDKSLKVYREAIMQALQTWAEVAAGDQAALAAWRWGLHPTFGFAMSGLLVHRRERDPGPVEAELARLTKLLEVPQPSDEFPPRLEEVDLKIGRAVRMHAVRQPAPDGGQAQHLMMLVEFWIPFGVTDLIQMTFTTSNLALGPDLAAEYDEIAKRLLVIEEKSDRL